MAGGDAQSKNGRLLRPAAGGSPSGRACDGRHLRSEWLVRRRAAISWDGHAVVSWDARATGVPWFDGKLRQPAKLGLDLGNPGGGEGEGEALVVWQRDAGRPKATLSVPRCRCRRSDPGSTGKERLASRRRPANRLPHPALLAKQTMATETHPSLRIV